MREHGVAPGAAEGRAIVRCAEHGLAFDPEQASGCVLCRRASSAVSSPSLRLRPLLRWFSAALVVAGVVVFVVRERTGSPLGEKIRVFTGTQSGSIAERPGEYPAEVDAELWPEVSGALLTMNSENRSGAFFLPQGRRGVPMPILVAIHATGASGHAMVELFRALSIQHHFAIVAPDSRRSPTGEWTWQVGQRPSEVTPDLTHISACLSEFEQRFSERLDGSRTLIAGYSGGGSSAPYVATRVPKFAAFAVLHGGVFAGGLGEIAVRGWFSTGSLDPMRPPAHVRHALAQAQERGLHQLVYREFPVEHGLLDEEKRALIDWWLY